MAGEKVKPKCKKKDLISLVWPVNTTTSTLIAGAPKGVAIDKVAGTWIFEGRTYQIGGDGRYNASPYFGSPIGVSGYMTEQKWSILTKCIATSSGLREEMDRLVISSF